MSQNLKPNKPSVSDLPDVSDSYQKWFDALRPRIMLAEWAIKVGNINDKVDAQNILHDYFFQCPHSFQNLRDIASDEVDAIDLQNTDAQIQALQNNMAEYKKIDSTLKASA